MNIGEQTAIQYYSKKGYTVKPVMDISEYWKKDIDIVLTSPDGTTETVECKYDLHIHRTGNLFVELITDKDNNKQGWYQYIESDTIWYLDAVKMIAYTFKTDDLKQYMENHDTDQKNAPDRNNKGEIKKVSVGALVPLQDFSKEYQVTVIPL